MLRNIFKSTNLSFAELITLTISLGIGYLLIYKISYLRTLDIEWYLTLISPQEVAFSSISLIFVSLLTASITLLCLSLIKFIESRNKIVSIIFSILIIGLLVILSDFIGDLKHRDSIFIEYGVYNAIFIIMYQVYQSALNFLNYKNDQLIKSIKKSEDFQRLFNVKSQNMEYIKIRLRRKITIINVARVLPIILGVYLLIFIPMEQGIEIAKVIKQTPEKMLNEVKILKQKENEKWYLLEINRQNALIIQVKQKTKENIFRIIEIKELKEIKDKSS